MMPFFVIFFNINFAIKYFVKPHKKITKHCFQNYYTQNTNTSNIFYNIICVLYENPII